MRSGIYIHHIIYIYIHIYINMCIFISRLCVVHGEALAVQHGQRGLGR